MIDQKLLSYIKQKVNDGTSKETISTTLTKAGWEISEIEEGFLEAGTLRPMASPSSLRPLPPTQPSFQPPPPIQQTEKVMPVEQMSPQPDYSDKPRSKAASLILVGVCILVFIGVLGTAGYLVYQQYKSPKIVAGPQQTQSSQQTVPPETKLKVTTTNYNAVGIYTNDAQNYQINYVAGTKLQETTSFNKYCATLSYKGGYVTVASLKDDKAAMESGQASVSCAKINGLAGGYVPAPQQVTVDGKKYSAQGYWYANKLNDPLHQYHNAALIFPLTDNITIQFGYMNPDTTKQVTDKDYNDTMTIIKQMLSTFKFINPVESTNQTYDWKTYTNNQYGFDFQYPLDWGSPVVSGTLVHFPKNNFGILYVAYSSNQLDNSQASTLLGITSINSFNEVVASVDTKVSAQKDKGTRKDFTVNGTRAIEYTSSSGSLVLFDGNKGFLYGGTNSEMKISQQVFETFISTFRFTK